MCALLEQLYSLYVINDVTLTQITINRVQVAGPLSLIARGRVGIEPWLVVCSPGVRRVTPPA